MAAPMAGTCRLATRVGEDTSGVQVDAPECGAKKINCQLSLATSMITFLRGARRELLVALVLHRR